MKRPNILMLLPDEFRQSAMGFLGQDAVQTPNLDALARQSVHLPNAVSSYPVCSPYRAQMLTGQYPWSNGVIGNCNSATAQFGVRLHPKQTCLSDVLKAHGYRCGYVGKWHLDTPEPSDLPYIAARRNDGKLWDAYTPPERRHGFDFWYSYGCNDQHFAPHYWTGEGGVETVLRHQGFAPRHEADVAIDFLRSQTGDQPFFLCWSPNPPHMPFDQVPQDCLDRYPDLAPEAYLTRPNALEDPAPAEIPEGPFKDAQALRAQARRHVRNYFALVSAIDDQVGRILRALEETGLADDTIVLFTSDHGEMMGSHSLMYKGLWYDECFKVPFLLRYPGRIAPGAREAFLNPPDLMPTLLDLCGIDALPPGMEGRSLAPYLLTGVSPKKDEGFYINPQVNARGVMNHEHYYVVVRDWRDRETEILYDLRKDPYQMRNIAAERPELVRALRARLWDWLSQTKDLWTKHEEEANL